MKTTTFYKAMLCIFLLFASVRSNYAQVLLQSPANAPVSGIGGIYSPLSDTRAALGNPAGLAFNQQTSISASIDRKFVLKELQTVSLAACLPLANWGGLAACIESGGFEAFRQTRVGLAYGKNLIAEKFALGLRLWWLQTSIPDYGNAGLPSFDLGIMGKLSEKIMVGVYAASPVRVKLASEPLDGLIRWGLAYMPSFKVTIFAELEKDFRHPLTGKTGIEYCPVPQLVLRCGWNSEPAAIYAGLGFFITRQWSIDWAFSYHQWLGFSPVFSIYFRQKKQK